jgi:hypothetical protein
VTFREPEELMKLTAAGTVRDLHPIPSLNFLAKIHHHLFICKDTDFFLKLNNLHPTG